MSEAASRAEQTIAPAIKWAASDGVRLEDLVSILSRSVEDAFPMPGAKFFAAGIAGRRALLGREGGCVSAREASELYAGPAIKKQPNPETARRAAREDRLIAIHDGHGDLRFPVWQFAETGGALDGLAEVLRVLRGRPSFSEITPFVFFLQPHPRIHKSPLAALRTGNVAGAVAAAQSEMD